ncbi:MAG: hypothetical protein LBS88_07205 [Tannerellaceae bacterium]|jgi:hypothetical protein|nr:hypothetical protein [Tannerellaceae bacterium]
MSEIDYRVKVDVKEINALLSQLNDRQSKNAIKSGLRKSASIIRKDAQQNLSSAIPKARRLRNDINLTVYKDASGARVDLLDHRKKGSKQFILKFFELGTDDGSRNRAGNFRGKRIAEYRFLKQATESKKAEAERVLESNIIASINRVIEKNK